MILIELNPQKIELLLKAKTTTKRSFNNWDFEQLLNEAIYEFYYKYGEKE